MFCFSYAAQHLTRSQVKEAKKCEGERTECTENWWQPLLVHQLEQVKARQGKTFVRLANLQKFEKEKKEKGHEIREYRVLTGLPLLSCSVSIPADLTAGRAGPQPTTIRDTGSDGSDPPLTPFRFLIYHSPRNSKYSHICRHWKVLAVSFCWINMITWYLVLNLSRQEKQASHRARMACLGRYYIGRRYTKVLYRPSNPILNLTSRPCFVRSLIHDFQQTAEHFSCCGDLGAPGLNFAHK